MGLPNEWRAGSSYVVWWSIQPMELRGIPGKLLFGYSSLVFPTGTKLVVSTGWGWGSYCWFFTLVVCTAGYRYVRPAARSPDLDPIENLWSIIDQRLTKEPVTSLGGLRSKLSTLF